MSLSKSEMVSLLNLSESTYLKYLVLKYKKKRLPIQQIYKERFMFGEFHCLYGKLRGNAGLFLTFTRMQCSTWQN
jgi:hypothetical protein